MSSPHDDAKRIEAMHERLDEVEEEIEEAERDADKVLPRHPKETFAQPGTIGTDEVDNAIVPPG
jgi:hypothetical protein